MSVSDSKYSDSSLYVWTHPSIFYSGPCFQCETHIEKQYPIKIRCEGGAIHFCTYECLSEYRESLSRKKS